MKYTLLRDFVPVSSCEGEPGVDAHGKYILFPADMRDRIISSDFLKTSSGKIIQIKEDSSQTINEIRYLKLYYT